MEHQDNISDLGPHMQALSLLDQHEEANKNLANLSYFSKEASIPEGKFLASTFAALALGIGAAATVRALGAAPPDAVILTNAVMMGACVVGATAGSILGFFGIEKLDASLRKEVITARAFLDGVDHKIENFMVEHQSHGLKSLINRRRNDHVAKATIDSTPYQDDFSSGAPYGDAPSFIPSPRPK